jgi:hypothetical protein
MESYCCSLNPRIGFQINLINVNSQTFSQDAQGTTFVCLTAQSAKTLLPITAAKAAIA